MISAVGYEIECRYKLKIFSLNWMVSFLMMSRSVIEDVTQVGIINIVLCFALIYFASLFRMSTRIFLSEVIRSMDTDQLPSQ